MYNLYHVFRKKTTIDTNINKCEGWSTLSENAEDAAQFIFIYSPVISGIQEFSFGRKTTSKCEWAYKTFLSLAILS